MYAFFSFSTSLNNLFVAVLSSSSSFKSHRYFYNAILRVHFIIILVSFTIPNCHLLAVIALRMYAIYAQDMRVFVTLFVLGLVPPAISVVCPVNLFFETLQFTPVQFTDTKTTSMALVAPFYGCGVLSSLTATSISA